ncbi:asparaginase [Virgibacillus xinjiangensis]|uniref:asparaginase n=1 Tax=Virgibacillus xinjiangensis TaxID=393090 RepID=A0ABV7CRN9_9BACI
MKDILMIHTGGTISMLENKETGEVNSTGEHPLTDIAGHFRHTANIHEKIALNLPSPQMTPHHMLQLAKTVKENYSNHDGVVITHGTDTLEETAYFLDLVLGTEKPVILTGAMRSSNEIGSDALYNLISAVRVAADHRAGGKGVLVVMNDEIHTAANVTKTSTSNVATFQSPQQGPIGSITKETVLFHHPVFPRKTKSVGKISKKVFLLKAYAGMSRDIFEALLHTDIDGLVIEAFGQGNLPKETVEPLAKLLDKGIPVVLVSRSYQGVVQPTYGYRGGGKELYKMGVIFSNGLTGPKARIKLLIELEKTSNFSVLQESFKEQ